jgi:cell fate (sporulation/competence/biofilm development) regulator YmcA (YheA/YmcA/DUF963 family)
MIEDQKIQTSLEQLNQLLADYPVIKEFQQIQLEAQQNSRLKSLEEEIKQAQKEAVQFAHYGKPEAERAAIQRIEELTQQYNQHPVVQLYRERLAQANELLQYVTQTIQKRVNQAIEEGTQRASEN